MSIITFSGSISNSTLTVTSTPVGGSLAIGNTIQAPNILPNTSIIALGTGTGGTGTYILNKSQTISSISMTANSEQTLIASYQSLDSSAVVSFYQLDLTTLGGSILYFTNEKNEKLESPTWQGQVYTSIPIEVKGFDINSSQFPRPTLKLSNYAGVMSGLAKLYSDLVGPKVKFTRKRTRLKYLDAVNFTSGVNASADPNTYYPDDIYYVNRKIGENRLFVEWELASALDISGVMLPRRQIIQNICMWKYRSAECSYAGSNYFDINDQPTTVNNDICAKNLSSCKLRFPTGSLPYGGFPGANLSL